MERPHGFRGGGAVRVKFTAETRRHRVKKSKSRPEITEATEATELDVLGRLELTRAGRDAH
jgi:hypothetical protein